MQSIGNVCLEDPGDLDSAPFVEFVPQGVDIDGRIEHRGIMHQAGHPRL